MCQLHLQILDKNWAKFAVAVFVSENWCMYESNRKLRFNWQNTDLIYGKRLTWILRKFANLKDFSMNLFAMGTILISSKKINEYIIFRDKPVDAKFAWEGSFTWRATDEMSICRSVMVNEKSYQNGTPRFLRKTLVGLHTKIFWTCEKTFQCPKRKHEEIQATSLECSTYVVY